MENIKKEVEETAAVQKENFAKLNERQRQSLNEIFTKYEQNKVKLDLEFTHKGGFLGADKTEKFSMDSIILADDSFAYTLVHSKDSPFRLQPKSRSLVSVKGEISGNKLKNPIPARKSHLWMIQESLSYPFISTKNLVETTDMEIFSAPENPYLFSEAVVVDSKESRLGKQVLCGMRKIRGTSKLNILILPF